MTRNPLAEESRAKMVDALNGTMAEILDLHYQTLLAHWNVRGPNFIGLHDLFEKLAGSNGAENWCDRVAERIGQLGGPVETTVHHIARNTTLAEYPVTITDGADHVRHVAGAYGAIIGRFREGAALAESMGDPVTASILTDVQVEAEKHLWLLEAHESSSAS